MIGCYINQWREFPGVSKSNNALNSEKLGKNPDWTQPQLLVINHLANTFQFTLLPCMSIPTL